MSPFAKQPRINSQIRSPRVLLIMDGKKLGVVAVSEALQLADERNLDLVEVAPQENPPVCVLTDYGKYQYESSKKQKEKKQRTMEMKEVRLSAGIDDHDVQTKIKQLRHFLEQGKQVKVTVYFKKRQIAHVDVGQKIMSRILESIVDLGNVDAHPRLEDKNLSARISPKPI